jgi:hypothetical protein
VKAIRREHMAEIKTERERFKADAQVLENNRGSATHVYNHLRDEPTARVCVS